MKKKNTTPWLDSTKKGAAVFVLDKLKPIFWLGIGYIACLGIIDWAIVPYAEYGISHVWELMDYSNFRQSPYPNSGHSMLGMLALIGKCILLASMICVGFYAIANAYRAGDIHNISYDSESEKWFIDASTCRFFLRVVENQWAFHKLVSVSTDQSTFERLAGTGSVLLKIIRFDNADSEPFTVSFHALTDPEAVKDRLEELLPKKYEGLRVQMLNDEKTELA